MKQRLKKFRQWMKKANLSHYLAKAPADIAYFSGFRGDDSLLLISQRHAVIISDHRYTAEITQESDIPWVATNSKIAKAAELVADTKDSILGFDPDDLSHGDFLIMRKGLAAKRLKPCERPTVALRIQKDEEEIKYLKKALRIGEKAFSQTLDTITPGMTEKQIALQLESNMIGLGAQGPAFETIVAVNANAALPHAVPGKKKLSKKGCLLIDWGARFNGYHSDLTRMICWGKPSPRLREVLTIVQAAQDAAIDIMAPGQTTDVVDKAARSIIDKAGYGKEFKHSTGHGVGLDIHEFPRLSAGCREILKPGMVLTVEPGIYLDGQFGVRLEEMVLITDTGHQRLSRLPMIFEH